MCKLNLVSNWLIENMTSLLMHKQHQHSILVSLVKFIELYAEVLKACYNMFHPNNDLSKMFLESQ